MTRNHRNQVGGEGAHFEVGGTFAEFERAYNSVGNDAEADRLQVRVCKYKP
jgi:hypothetical protein